MTLNKSVARIDRSDARRQDSILERLGRARHAMGTAILFLRFQYTRVLFVRWLKLQLADGFTQTSHEVTVVARVVLFFI